ncbi:class I SAM-dependent methyltransferase [Alkalihalobacillus sp. AL-G]|uniref:class I SAM-dependent methyltransferase n=1 Tax=Alkalihalobacillus sp. AL-G TaxID=2926399 RepID=UPI00272DACA6|nr:SAM-dependent methyltransferase [Alkalihalobacillus sp. AL-G]WLD92054.1 SAM-dependent methyltransferase [Alkalihalobacillus sp. AL-G]
MTDRGSQIVQILDEKIQQAATMSISYADFIETVLYHQEHGYYRKTSTKIGTSGDFYTSSSVHPVFAWVFAEYFYKYLSENNPPYSICEIGGGNGSFAKEVLTYLKVTYPEFLIDLNYFYIDVSEDHLVKAQQELASFSCVSFFNSWEGVTQPFHGIVFSNELIDAFPVHVIEEDEGDIFEVRVTLDSTGKLIEKLVPLNNPMISEWLDWSGLALTEGQRLEAPLEMLDWIEQMSEFIDTGLLITVDYGYWDKDWQEPSHRRGSLRGYKNHQLIENPLLNAGQMDLTTHIHLDALLRKGEKVGFRSISSTRQREFLLNNGLFNFLHEHQNPDPFSKESRLNRAIRSFATPGGISDSFHVIVQEKRG